MQRERGREGVLVIERGGRAELVLVVPEDRLAEFDAILIAQRPLLAIARLGEDLQPTAYTDPKIDVLAQRHAEAGETGLIFAPALFQQELLAGEGFGLVGQQLALVLATDEDIGLVAQVGQIEARTETDVRIPAFVLAPKVAQP